jgi:hypothetical protein
LRRGAATPMANGMTRCTPCFVGIRRGYPCDVTQMLTRSEEVIVNLIKRGYLRIAAPGFARPNVGPAHRVPDRPNQGLAGVVGPSRCQPSHRHQPALRRSVDGALERVPLPRRVHRGLRCERARSRRVDINRPWPLTKQSDYTMMCGQSGPSDLVQVSTSRFLGHL